MPIPDRWIWERYELDYTRKPSLFRSYRRILYVVASATAIAWLVMATMARGKMTFASGEMSQAHAAFANDCAQCHGDSFRRIVHPFSHVAKQFDMNDDCLHCHGPTIGHNKDPYSAWHQFRRDDHAGRIESRLACSGCHVEHEGQARLAVVADARCTECHADLTALTDKPVGQRDPHITDFHHRRPGETKSGHPPFIFIPPDKQGRLKFTHADHMTKHKGPNKETLICADCHRAGRSSDPWRFGQARLHEITRVTPPEFASEPSLQDDFMGEIRYSLHCQGCHGLVAGSKAKLIDGDGDLGKGRIPHAQPDAVHSYLLREITEYFDDPQRVARTPPRDPPPKTALDLPSTRVEPAPRKPQDEQSLKEHLVEVNNLVSQIEKEIFGESSEDSSDWHTHHLTARCLKCHFRDEKSEERTRSPFIVEPPNIPARWLSHARFSHDKHKVGLPNQRDAQAACVHCHKSAMTGNEAKDMMIPDIDLCVGCHGSPRELLAGRTSSIANQCVNCHSFHLPPNQPADLEMAHR